jgi:hypothetical protein
MTLSPEDCTEDVKGLTLMTQKLMDTVLCSTQITWKWSNDDKDEDEIKRSYK